MNRRTVSTSLLVAIAAALILVTPVTATAASPPLPTSMAAVGDSITAATDVGWCCVNPDGGNPQYSWSTGTDPAVFSHYQRILAANGGVAVTTLNAAVPGADSGDLAGQFAEVSAFGAEYVTVMMGGNDICWNPTSVAVFRKRVQSAFASLFATAPNTSVFVSSIPNIYRLWSVEHSNWIAQATWNLFNICPEMLRSDVTEAQRQRLLGLEQKFNDILASTCAQYAGCRWDGYATFNYQFTAADISTVDYFHPSFTGQNRLAAVTWDASYWS